MKHAQLDVVRIGKLVEQLHQRDLGPVQLPVAGEDSAVLVAVAVAQHDVLLGTRPLHQLRDSGQCIELAHDGSRVAQVRDRLEQGHNDQFRGCHVVQRSAQQSDLLLQQQHLQQVAHRFGVADDVVPNRLGAELLAHPPRHFKDRDLVLAVLRISCPYDPQRPRIGEQIHQQLALVRFRHLAVVSLHPGGRQQLRDDQLMLVRALPQVHRRQVEAEHLHRAHQRVQSLRHKRLGVVRQQRGADGAQVGQEIFRASVCILRRDRMAGRIAAGEGLERRGQPRVDARQGPSVWFILAMLVGVGRALGQRLHLGRYTDQHG